MKTETEIMDPTYDCVFKAILLDEENIEFLKTIISLITKIDIKDLENIHVENVEHPIKHKTDKRMKSDIIVKVDSHIINIEMNKDYYEGIIEKNNIYAHRIMGEQVIINESYTELKEVFQINFDNYTKFKGNKEVYEFVLKERETNEILTENFIEYHVDLEYMKKKCYHKNTEEMSLLERYCLVFKSKTQEYLDGLKGDDEILKRVSDKIARLNEDEKILGLYDAEKEERIVYNTRIAYATKVGMEKGIKKGVEKGRKEGIIDMVKNLLEQNVPMDIIIKSSGLTEKEILDLK